MAAPSETSVGPARRELLSQAGPTGESLRSELTALYDRWLASLLPDVAGVALVAVGGLGRRETAPWGDLDLVLLHDSRYGRPAEIGRIADAVWYPIWDEGLGLDHSVRTVAQAAAVAEDDLKAMLGMLDARHVAGDRRLTDELRERVVQRWRGVAVQRLPELRRLSQERWQTHGDASFLLEPDLKDSRGGLRDWVGLRALASAQLLQLSPAVRRGATTMLDVRGESHRVTGRGGNVFRAQDRSAVAAALGLAGGDEALRAVNEAARAIAHASDLGWRRVASANRPASGLRRLRLGVGRPSAAAIRTPLARDVVAHDGEVVLARAADPGSDPGLPLRVARAAAEADLPISDHTLSRLAAEAPALPAPWPDSARADLVALLGAGRQAVYQVETLDQHGLWARLLPEWDLVRYRAQHNPVHLYTVDRHLVETAVRAGERASEVARPDLLLVGAFLHDIGKAYPGDHSVAGAEVAAGIASRMGFSAADAAVIGALARHHLLLPDTATRRDLDDPSTSQIVLSAIDGSRELLELLHNLTIADAAATGPAAWSEWKAGLVAELVRRVDGLLGGRPLTRAEAASPELAAVAREISASGSPSARVIVDGVEVTVLVPDAPGVLSGCSGLFALHALDVQAADVRTVGGVAVNKFTVAPKFGRLPDAALLETDLRRIMARSLPLADRLRAKEEAYRKHAPAEAAESARLLWFDDEATDATVLEVRTQDAIGLLHRVTAALEESGMDVRSARVSSLGSRVVDAFYLADTEAKPLSLARRDEVESAVRRALRS